MVEVRTFPGGHDNVLEALDDGSFAEALQMALEGAMRKYGADATGH